MGRSLSIGVKTVKSFSSDIEKCKKFGRSYSYCKYGLEGGTDWFFDYERESWIDPQNDSYMDYYVDIMHDYIREGMVSTFTNLMMPNGAPFDIWYTELMNSSIDSEVSKRFNIQQSCIGLKCFGFGINIKPLGYFLLDEEAFLDFIEFTSAQDDLVYLSTLELLRLTLSEEDAVVVIDYSY